MERERLVELVDRGATLHEIAATCGVTLETARKWLRRHGLQTARMRRLAAAEAAREDGLPVAVMLCSRHGMTEFRVGPGRRHYRCSRCQSEDVTSWRRRAKETLVREMGGACRLCGYSAYLEALQFHHVDPGTKVFALGGGGVVRSLERMRAEARKCILVCANCHAEIEAGRELDYPVPRGPG
jgi:DNA-directed RNA polymerase subunit RPC12/RpoP